MADLSYTRRRFLASTSVVGALALLGSRRAFAFTPQAMNAETHQAWLDRCSNSNDPYHAKLLDEARVKLRAAGETDAQIAAALAGLTCPVCGCNLAASAPAP